MSHNSSHSENSSIRNPQSAIIRLLIIEDDPNQVNLISRYLAFGEKGQYEVKCAACLSEGLELIAKESFDVVLLDLNLPDSSGIETVEKIKPYTSWIPVVVLTGLDDEEIALNSLKMGAEDYLTKGAINNKDLLRSIRYAVERNRLKAELRKSEEEYKNLVNYSSDCICHLDLDGKYLYMSPSGTKMRGLDSFENIRGKNVLSDMKEEYQASMEEAIQRGAKGESTALEYISTTPEGKDIWWDTIINPMDRQGKISGFCVISREITDRKIMEQKLRKSDKSLSQAQEIAGMGNWEWVVGTDEFHCSAQVYRILGLKPRVLTSNVKTFFDSVHPQDRPCVKQLINESLFKNKSFEMEHRILKPDGALSIVNLKGRVQKDGTGKPTQVTGVIQDITERKRAEEKVLFFKKLFNFSSDAIFAIDPETSHFLEINDKACSNLGYSREELLKMGVIDIEEKLPTIQLWKEHVKELKAKNAIILEGKHKRKDGSVFPVEINVRHVTLGRKDYMIAVARDITERIQTGKEIVELKKRIEFVLGATKTGLDIIDADFNVRYIDPEWEKTYGPPEGRKCFEYFAGLDEPCLNCGIPEALKTKKPIIEEQTLPKEGNRPIQVTSIPFQNEKGEWLVAEANVDISELKQTEKQIIRQSKILGAINKIFQEALKCGEPGEVGDMFLEVAQELTGSKFGFIGEINEAGLFDTLAITNPGWDTCIVPESEARKVILNMPIRGVDRATMRDGKSRITNSEEAIKNHPDHVEIPEGHPPVTRFLGVPLKQAGKVIGMAGLGNKESDYNIDDQECIEALSFAFVEAVERKRVEIALNRIFNMSPDMICSGNFGAYFTKINPAFEKTLGYTAQELLQKRFLELIHPDDIKATEKEVERALAGKEIINIENRYRCKDGAYKWLSWTVRAFASTNSFYAVAKDVTKQKLAEETVMRSEKLASLGTLSAGVAHEILNPLNIISATVQVMQMEELPGEMRENLEEIMAQVHRASKITNNLRMFARKKEAEIGPVDLHELFEKTALLIEHELKLDNIVIERDYDADLPVIYADEDQLAQVLLNLITNARDAMKGRKKNIITFKTKTLENKIEIRFSDNGPGIPQNIINLIFDPFFTTKDPGQGTGLGLSITHSIIEAHRGTIGVESEKGKGTVFVITLPIGKENREQAVYSKQ